MSDKPSTKNLLLQKHIEFIATYGKTHDCYVRNFLAINFLGQLRRDHQISIMYTFTWFQNCTNKKFDTAKFRLEVQFTIITNSQSSKASKRLKSFCC